MRTHIDWITFTMSMVYDTDGEDLYARAIQNAFIHTFTPDMVASVFGGAWATEQRSRAPYTDTWVDRNSGLSLYASPQLSHCCIEISGEGCEKIIAMGKMEVLLAAIVERVTRIDIATDINTDITPLEFVSQTSHNRMRSSGHHDSETGLTRYVGSKESERFARVYRYFYPHPRWHLLRVEHVFRRDYAKAVAKSIVENSLGSVETACGEAFGWNHPEWQTGQEPAADIALTSPERNAGKTVSWLVRSVAPAIQRLIADGTIRDPEAFFKTYFLPPNPNMLD